MATETENKTPLTFDSLELNKDAAREFWLLLLFRGISMFSFGFVAVIWPKATLLVVAYIAAIYLLTVGMLDIINGFRMVSSKSLWFLKVALGFAEVGVALYLLNGGLVLTTLVFLQAIGLILVLQSIIEFVVSFRGDIHPGLRVLSLFSALLGFVVGIVLVRYPISSGLTFTWLLGLYGVVGGSMMIAAAFAVRPSKS